MSTPQDAPEERRDALTTTVCPHVRAGICCTCQCANNGIPLPHPPGLCDAVSPQLCHQLECVMDGDATPSHWLRILACPTDQLEQLLFVNGRCPWGNNMPLSNDKAKILVCEASMRIRDFFSTLGRPGAVRTFTEGLRGDLNHLAELRLTLTSDSRVVTDLWVSLIIGHASDVSGKDRVRVRYLVSIAAKHATNYYDALCRGKLHDNQVIHTVIWPSSGDEKEGLRYPTVIPIGAQGNKDRTDRARTSDTDQVPSTDVRPTGQSSRWNYTPGRGSSRWNQPAKGPGHHAPGRGGSSGGWGRGRAPAAYHAVDYWNQDDRIGGVKFYTPAQYAELERRDWDPDLPRSGSLARPFEGPAPNELPLYIRDMIRDYEARKAAEAAARQSIENEGHPRNPDGSKWSSALVQASRAVPSSPKHRSTSSASLRPLLRHATSFRDIQTPSLVKKRSVTFGLRAEDAEPPSRESDANTAPCSAEDSPVARQPRRSSPVPEAFFERNRPSYDTSAELERWEPTDDVPTSSSAASSTPSVVSHNENAIAHTPSTPEHGPDTPIHALQPPESSLKGKEPERVIKPSSCTERNTQHRTLNPYVPGPDPWGIRARMPFEREPSPHVSSGRMRQDRHALLSHSPISGVVDGVSTELLPAGRHAVVATHLASSSQEDNESHAHRLPDVPANVQREETSTVPPGTLRSGSSVTIPAAHVIGENTTTPMVNVTDGESGPSSGDAPSPAVPSTSGLSLELGGAAEIIELSDNEEIDVTTALITAPIDNTTGEESTPASGEAPIAAVPSMNRPPPATTYPDIIELLSDDDDDKEIEVLLSLPPTAASSAATTKKRKWTSSESDGAASTGGPVQTRRKANPGTGSGADPWIVSDSDSD